MSYKLIIENKYKEPVTSIVNKEQLNKLMLLLADTEEFILLSAEYVRYYISGKDLLDVIKEEIRQKNNLECSK